MCIFSGEIEHVSNTKIFTSVVYPSRMVIKKVNGVQKGFKIPEGKPLQIIIYSNSVQSSDFTKLVDTNVPGIKTPMSAMILPVPLIKGSNRIKILDMSKYGNFFEDIDMVFPSTSTNGFRGLINQSYGLDEDGMLNIEYVGNYKASIVPNFKSFDKLKYDEFNLTADVKKLLQNYYKDGFAFIVCILNNKNSKPSQFHPFAYVHELRTDGRIFIPTRHYHKKIGSNPFAKYYNPTDAAYAPVEKSTREDKDETDEVNDYIYGTLMVDDKWMKLTAKRKDLQSYREKEELDWDHEIYVVNFPRLTKNALLKKPGVRIINGDLNRLVNFYTYIEASKLPKEIVLTKPAYLFKIKIDGNYKYNHDLYI